MGGSHSAVFRQVQNEPTTESLSQLFSKFDKNGNGVLEKDEMNKFFDKLFDFLFSDDYNYPLGKLDIINEWRSHFDKNHDGELSKNEFLLVVKKILL